MDEYSIDEIGKHKGKEEPEYKHVGTYKINIILNKENICYSIDTVVSKSGEIGWLRSNGESVHTQNVKLENIKRENIGRIIHQTYPVIEREKKDVKSILKDYKPLVEKMLADYVAYYKKNFKK